MQRAHSSSGGWMALNHEHDALELELERTNGGRPAKNDDETAGRLYASQHVPAVPWTVSVEREQRYESRKLHSPPRWVRLPAEPLVWLH